MQATALLAARTNICSVSTGLQRLILRATTDGWALFTDSGAVVFRRAGLGARRACLAFARDHGVLSLAT